jgi:hypothetical protein
MVPGVVDGEDAVLMRTGDSLSRGRRRHALPRQTQRRCSRNHLHCPMHHAQRLCAPAARRAPALDALPCWRVGGWVMVMVRGPAPPPRRRARLQDRPNGW